MARTTPAEVEELVEVDPDVSLTPFINAANELVTEKCTDSDYTDTRLTMIETWLAAHFYQIRDQAVAMERAGDVQAQYQYKIDLALNQTKYGQMAMMLDTAGNLAKLNEQITEGKGGSIHVGWLGTDYDTEDDED